MHGYVIGTDDIITSLLLDDTASTKSTVLLIANVLCNDDVILLMCTACHVSLCRAVIDHFYHVTSLSLLCVHAQQCDIIGQFIYNLYMYMSVFKCISVVYMYF